MTPSTIIKQAQADGVTLALSAAGGIKAVGNGEAVNRWLPVLREHKTELLDELARLPKDLEQRIEYVAAFHAFTSDELEEAKEIASGDLENAAVCFRALCAEIQLCTKDNNR